MLMESSGLLIPLVSFLHVARTRSERGDDRFWRFKSGDPRSDAPVVGEASIDLGDGRLEFGSTVERRLRPSGLRCQ